MTLVDVPAMLAILTQHVTIGTLAIEGTDCVSTSPVAAKEGHNSALVDISAVVVRAEFESRITDALVSAECVHARSIVANVRVTLTLVDVHASVPVPRQRETRVADTLKASL